MNDSNPPIRSHVTVDQSLLHLQVPRDAHSTGIIATLIAPIVEVEPSVLEARLNAGPTYVGPFAQGDVEAVAQALRSFGARVQIVPHAPLIR